ncbi:hypothetical protein MUK42_23904, partial [Musa troglodytarum]
SIHALPLPEEHEETPVDHTQPSALRFLNAAVNGACDQSRLHQLPTSSPGRRRPTGSSRPSWRGSSGTARRRAIHVEASIVRSTVRRSFTAQGAVDSYDMSRIPQEGVGAEVP